MSKINVPFALLSVATSVFLWASVYNAQNRKPNTQIFNVTLTTQNLKTDSYVVTSAPEYVTLTMAGLPDDIRKISHQTLSAIVDLSNPKEGDNTYPVIIFPSNARELLVSNGVIAHITVEKVLTKRFDVTLFKNGNLPSGFHEDSFEPSLGKIYVTGPAETVKKVTAVQLPINLSSLSKSPYEAEVEARAIDATGRIITKLMLTPTDEKLDYKVEDISPLRVHVSYKFSADPLPSNQNPPRL